MDWLTVISLIAVGIFLVVAEIVFIPGIFIAGSIGVLLSGFGIYLSFQYFGDNTGWIILVVTVIGNLLAVFFTLRGKSWERFSLHETNDGRAYDDLSQTLHIGDQGVSISTLRPIGKAVFNDKIYEVRSAGNYISENIEIEITKIDSSRIFVKPVNEE